MASTEDHSAGKAVPVLVRFEKRPERFDLSPWVNRLEALLTFSQTTFKLDEKKGDSRAAPRGTLPVLKLGEEIIPDSLFSYETLIKRGLAKDLDAGLDAAGLAQSRLVQSLIEELYWILIKERWHDEFYTARDTIALSFLPYPMRVAIGHLIYRKISARLSTFGYLTRPQSEVDHLRDTALDTLSTLVGDKKYIQGGDNPTRADAIVFGFLSSIFQNARWTPKFLAAIQARPNLVPYVDRLRQTWFPSRSAWPRL